MSVNKHQPHVLVLPEDDANRQLANGFVLDHGIATRKIQVLPEAGGWMEVLAIFKREHIQPMGRYVGRFMILLIDLDGNRSRVEEAKTQIPSELQERAFILGTLTEPEELRKRGLGSYERIGMHLASECREKTFTVWRHELLRHNLDEIARMGGQVRDLLFGSVS